MLDAIDEAVQYVKEVEVLRQRIISEDARHVVQYYRLVEDYLQAEDLRRSHFKKWLPIVGFSEGLLERLVDLELTVGGKLSIGDKRKFENALKMHDRHRVDSIKPVEKRKPPYRYSFKYNY